GVRRRALTEPGGASAWFGRGFLTYGTASKADQLGVSADTLHRHGAVSELTAGEMADGALARSRAQFALSITGIAGPGGAVPGKPVGTVCFGWSALDAGLRTETVQHPGARAQVRALACLRALRRALAQECTVHLCP